MTTVKQLRDALAQLGAGHDDTEVQVWLPGTYIGLEKSISINATRGKILIEGNVVEGDLR